MTRSEARRAAQKLLRAGYHHPRIIEDVETGDIYVQGENKCYMSRTVREPGDADDLVREAGRA